MRYPHRLTDWLIGFGVTAGVFALVLAGRLESVENAARDLLAGTADAAAGSSRVMVVAVDGFATDGPGAWPWPRDALAHLHDRIAAGEPRAIAYGLPLEQPENVHARGVLERMLEQHGDSLDARGRELFARARAALETDRMLAEAFAAGPPVILGLRFEPAPPPAGTRRSGESPRGMALEEVEPAARTRPPAALWPGSRLRAGVLRAPVPVLADAAELALWPPAGNRRNRATAAVPLAWHRDGQWLPALPAAIHARAGSAETPPRIRRGEGLETGDGMLRTGPHPLVYPRPPGDEGSIRTFSAAAVHDGDVAPRIFRDRLVLVGFAEAGEGSGIAAAADAAGMPPISGVARQTAALIEGDLFGLPEWSVWTRAGAFALVGLYLMFLLPYLGLAAGLAVTALFAVILANAQLLAMLVQAAWLPLATPLAALVTGHAVHAGRRSVGNVIGRFQAELTAANVRLGEALRGEGRLDEALRRLRRCTPDEDVLECMYGLGLDFERRRRYGEAVEAFAWIERHRPGHHDSYRRLQSNRQRQEQAALGLTVSRTATQTLLLSDGDMQKPMLGRYEIEREIGKGAMGVVYLGRDPRIGRTVAIKTLALDGDFEGQSIEEVKARFIREAETAGRLRHPNIVVIHDVGEEDDVAWIAMDYLEGTPMARFADEGALLPPGEIFAVMAQVADALEHAHGQGVVHRDIKPGNILYNRDSGHATVTDFGVARVSDHRSTRTGTVLGTPSYMSPEQVAGERVDGRSDIFSAGVTLYQLLSGVLPFDGDSLSNLMYRIANERHREIRKLRGDLPACATTITNRALAKEPDRRYTSAQQLARALRRCHARLG